MILPPDASNAAAKTSLSAWSANAKQKNYVKPSGKPNAPQDLESTMMPMSKSLVEQCNAQGGDLPLSTTWAWAIVRLRPGLPDVMIVGGPADSMTEAEDRARKAFRDLEDGWAQKRAEELVMS